MKFLVDGSSTRLAERIAQWPDGVAGQLLTPLTQYKLAASVFAIDNGAYNGLRLLTFSRMVARYAEQKPLFVVIPDKLGCHRTTTTLYEEHSHLALNCVRAFVAQDGFDGHPKCAGAIFIGGTDSFKDSTEALDLVRRSVAAGLHVHVGRVNWPTRFNRFADAGAHTCDGSGVSRYDHMFIRLRDRAR